MKTKLLLLGCVAIVCHVAMAAAPGGEPHWALDANGCKFLSPAPPDLQFTITWTGQCVDGFVSGRGEVRAGTWFRYIGEFTQGRMVKGIAEMNGSTYEGEFLDNLPHGTGKTTLAADGFITKGRYDRGRIDPKEVEFIWANNTRYRGEIDPRNLGMHGKGVLEYPDGGVYEGEFKNNQPEGNGVLKYADGEVRSGTFVAGQLSMGSIVYVNQTRYEGQLRGGDPNGQGRMVFSDGQFYEGGFVSGKYQGKGRLKYSTGGEYEGEFLAGDASGNGKMRFADGRYYEGQFLLGKLHGNGKLTRATGETFEGEWKSGELTGKCRIVIEQSVYDGQCIDSKASGQGRLEDKSRELDYTGEFVQDLFHGKGSLHLGRLAYEGMFKAGVIDGPGVLTVPNLTMRGDFKSGELVRGTLVAEDGRTFEIDAAKGEVFEVLKDGTKRPVDALPADIET